MTAASITRPQPTYRYNPAQIDRVLAFQGDVRAAALSAGVPENAARAWRKGDVPAYYAAAKREAEQEKLQQRAARFLRPQDARAGR